MILFFAPVLISAVMWCSVGVAALPEKVLRRYGCKALRMRCQAYVDRRTLETGSTRFTVPGVVVVTR